MVFHLGIEPVSQALHQSSMEKSNSTRRSWTSCVVSCSCQRISSSRPIWATNGCPAGNWSLMRSVPRTRSFWKTVSDAPHRASQIGGLAFCAVADGVDRIDGCPGFGSFNGGRAAVVATVAKKDHAVRPAHPAENLSAACRAISHASADCRGQVG